MPRERLDIVILGHVDHGKSTLVGRLLAETGSLPEGKLQAVRDNCRRNSKPFEYAFLLDALKDEQSQGITIDSARCFFKSARRDYIIIDAPGHVEFLKNMISGAARAQAALLVIDAKEGVRENSRRHGYLLSMLGISQVAVCVNKMDLAGYGQATFDAIVREYSAFLQRVGIEPQGFVPIAAREGDNLIARSGRMPWYDGPTVLEMLDGFQREISRADAPLRLPVQDIYKFTAEGDERRIVAGRIETGTVNVGDQVVFLPSGKRTMVASIEEFSAPARRQAVAGECPGLTLTTQVYIKPGEVLCRADEPQPKVTSRLRANIFWLGRQPMVPLRRYKMKLGAARVPVWLTELHTVIDASRLENVSRGRQIDRHDVAEVTLETLRPVACDLVKDIPQTGRFVIIDNYEIAGVGVVLDAAAGGQTLVQKHAAARERDWERSAITPAMRASRYAQRSTLVLITGPVGAGKATLAKALEEALFHTGRQVYYLGLSNSLLGVDSDLRESGAAERDEHLRRLGEISHLFTDAGQILITTVSDLDDDELEIVDTLNRPGDLLVVAVGEHRFTRRKCDLELSPSAKMDDCVRAIQQLLVAGRYLPEYYL
ncbi:MAG: GTP-binding protein [Phycisphaerae bacterium]